MHIAIAGNIGSGKTTLTGLLAKHYKWEAQYEPVMNNPYLSDYYKDIRRWSFNMEVFFLKERFRNVLDIAAHPDKAIVQDRSIYEGVYVFTANNYAQGQLSERDYQNYMDLFKEMENAVKYPDLLIYLSAPLDHLVRNIQKRGRDYEQTMSLEYLNGLNQRYEDFISNIYQGKAIVIDVAGMDFQNNKEDFGIITDKIDAELFGLFS